MKKIALSIVLLAGIAMLVGCGGDPNRPKTYPATVTIMMDGKPVADATVTLQPADNSHNNTPFGKTDENGVCNLKTFEEGDGAVPGEYLVAVRKVDVITEPDPSEEDPEGVKVIEERRVIPKKYEVFTNGFKMTITEEGPNEQTFDVSE